MNQRRHKQMERDSMFLGRENQYCENDYTTKHNVRFNVIPIKSLMTLFTELEEKNFTICMETQKTPNCQSSLEKEEWSWRNQPS